MEKYKVERLENQIKLLKKLEYIEPQWECRIPGAFYIQKNIKLLNKLVDIVNKLIDK